MKRIEDILSGQHTILEKDRDIGHMAQEFAARIVALQHNTQEMDEANYREVNLDSLEMSRARSVGGEHVTLEALRALGLDGKLAELGFNGSQIAASIGTINGRACAPGSERATHAWLQERSALGELIEYDFNKISLYGMYTVSDLLLKNKSVIEQPLFTREQALFGLRQTIALYDLTNTYFEGQGKNNSLTARGHSKEKRSDCPLVTLGLVLDGSGFPLRSNVFEGNVHEAQTLAEMIAGLEQQGASFYEKPTVVMDAGIAIEENIDWLRRHDYPYTWL